MPQYSLASSTWGLQEIEAIQRVIETGNFTMGENVRKYENVFAKKFGARFGVMLNSGSSANLALLTACRYSMTNSIKEGDEVIVPAVSWSTTYYPVSQIGAKLKFVDVNRYSLNIEIEEIKKAINRNTKAIFAVNLLGNPAEWLEMQNLAEEHGLILLEDNCESLGAKAYGKNSGTFGLGGTFSSFFSHHISTMEGGMVLTDDESLFQHMKSIRAHGWTRDLPASNFVWNKTGDDWEDLFRFVLPGYNLRPLEMEAAIGIIQLEKFDSFLVERKKNAKFLRSLMSELTCIDMQIENGESSWFGFALILKNELQGTRKQLVNILTSENIESRPIVSGNFTRNPVIKHLNHAPIGKMPNADYIHENGLFVGNHHYDLSIEIEHLINVLKRFERGILKND